MIQFHDQVSQGRTESYLGYLQILVHKSGLRHCSFIKKIFDNFMKNI
jgi:hypothetical protein